MTQDSTQSIITQAEKAYREGNFASAAGLFLQAGQALEQSGDPLKAAEMANNRSVALLQAGDGQAALEAVEGVDQVFSQAGDTRRLALTLGNQAAALEAVNRLDEALAHYRQCNDLLKQVGDTENRATVLKSISTLQIKMGHHLEAVASMDAALEEQKSLSVQERFLKKLLNVPMRMLKK